MGVSKPMRDPSEHQRRKPGARGSLVRLADGQPWLLAEPSFRPTPGPLTEPDLDAAIDRFHEQIILGDDVRLDDLFAAARVLLLANYDLTDAEAATLLEVEAGPEAEALARAVLESLFGPERHAKGYVDWIKASLLANGLSTSAIPASALNDVLTILMATNRTIPPAQFVDACRAARDRDTLEHLL